MNQKNIKFQDIKKEVASFDEIKKKILSEIKNLNNKKEVDTKLNDKELSFFNFLNSNTLNKDDKISLLFLMNKNDFLKNLINKEIGFFYNNKNNLLTEKLDILLSPILSFFEKEKLNIESLNLYNKKIKHIPIEVEYNETNKVKNIPNAWFSKIKDKSFEEIKGVIEHLKEKDKNVLIKHLKQQSYSISPFTSALLNSDDRVFEYILTIYKELNIDLKDYVYIQNYNNIKIRSKEIEIYKNQSHFDLAISQKKIKSAKLLEENNLNESLLHPFSDGGMFSYIKNSPLNTDEEKNFANQLVNYAINSMGVDYLFFNIQNNNLSQKEFIENFYFSHSNFKFLNISDEIFKNKENQEKYFNFLITLYSTNKIGISILISFFRDIDVLLNKTIDFNIFTNYRDFCLNQIKDISVHGYEKKALLDIINSDKNKVFYENMLLNKNIKPSINQVKTVTKFKI